VDPNWSSTPNVEEHITKGMRREAIAFKPVEANA
jgi:hypothetical protein